MNHSLATKKSGLAIEKDSEDQSRRLSLTSGTDKKSDLQK
jgi:hypothetical protein